MVMVMGSGPAAGSGVGGGSRGVRIPVRHVVFMFSPDGRFLAVGPGFGTQILRVFDLQTGELALEVLPVVKSNTKTWDFHPDRQEIAVSAEERSIHIYSLPDGKLRRRLATHPYGFWNSFSVEYDTAGERIALIHNGGKDGVSIISATDGKLVAARPELGFHLAWSPRSPEILAVAIDEKAIELWNTDTGEVEARCGPIFDGTIVAFHPTGDWIFSRGWKGELRVWDARTGRRMLEYKSRSWAPEFLLQSGGAGIGYEGDPETTRLLELHIGDISTTAIGRKPRETDFYGAIDVDPLGRHFATLGPGGAEVWDFDSRTPLGTIPVDPKCHRIRIDSDGSGRVPALWIATWS